MKTKDVPAIIMLLAGGVYCLFGILHQIPLTEFLLHLLAILLIFWMFGGIIKMVLDRFMGELVEEKEDEKDAEGEDSNGESNDDVLGTSDEEA